MALLRYDLKNCLTKNVSLCIQSNPMIFKMLLNGLWDITVQSFEWYAYRLQTTLSLKDGMSFCIKVYFCIINIPMVGLCTCIDKIVLLIKLHIKRHLYLNFLINKFEKFLWIQQSLGLLVQESFVGWPPSLGNEQ